MIKLDKHPARQLTNREISKILCGIVFGLVGHVDSAHLALGLRVLRDTQCRCRTPEEVYAEIVAEDPLSRHVTGPLSRSELGWWRALGAAVGAFAPGDWCSVRAVDEAVTWMLEHWPEITGAASPGKLV